MLRAPFRRSAYLIRVSVVPELFELMHQAVRLPLPIDFCAPEQREAGEPLVVPQVVEHRLDSGERGDYPFALRETLIYPRPRRMP